MSDPIGFRPRQHMTRWLDPWQLVKTGWVRVGARRADAARDTMSGQAAPVARYGVDGSGEDFWFDYVADLGDAFNPTMAVAWHLGRRSLRVGPDEEGLYPVPPASGLPRGRLLFMGGDQVYPYATLRRYRDQLVMPYSRAFEGDEGADLYAIPGNHDWYGKLAPFRSVFCEGGTVGAWRCRQSASWFAVALPHRWWVWGIDTGLGGDVNDRQREYFEAAAQELHPGDRIILCSPVPVWSLYRRHPEELEALEGFVTDVVGHRATVPLWLAGDSHLFAAFFRETDEGRQVHVISGGGGAFLQPTHHLLVNTRDGGVPEFALAEAWPSPRRSKELSDPGWKIMADRQSLALIPILATLILGYAALTQVRWLSWTDAPSTWSLPSSLAWVLSAPVSWLLLALVVRLSMLSISPNASNRLIGKAARRRGRLLGVGQAGIFVLAATIGRFGAENWGSTTASRWAWIVLWALVGGVASLALFGWFVARSNRGLDVSDNTTFSAYHLVQYKNFLRCRIDGKTGRLDLFALGIEEPGGGWAAAVRDGAAEPPPSCSGVEYVWGCSIGG